MLERDDIAPDGQGWPLDPVADVLRRAYVSEAAHVGSDRLTVRSGRDSTSNLGVRVDRSYAKADGRRSADWAVDVDGLVQSLTPAERSVIIDVALRRGGKISKPVMSSPSLGAVERLDSEESGWPSRYAKPQMGGRFSTNAVGQYIDYEPANMFEAAMLSYSAWVGALVKLKDAGALALAPEG